VAIYNLSGDEEAPPRLGDAAHLDRPAVKRPVAFFACDRPAEGTVPIHEVPSDGPGPRLQIGPTPSSPNDAERKPLFHALPPDTESPPASTVPLYRHVHTDGKTSIYLTGSSQSMPGYRRVEPPLCLVWRDPTRDPPP
jgi:hypothetical protein